MLIYAASFTSTKHACQSSLQLFVHGPDPGVRVKTGFPTCGISRRFTRYKHAERMRSQETGLLHRSLQIALLSSTFQSVNDFFYRGSLIPSQLGRSLVIRSADPLLLTDNTTFCCHSFISFDFYLPKKSQLASLRQ